MKELLRLSALALCLSHVCSFFQPKFISKPIRNALCMSDASKDTTTQTPPFAKSLWSERVEYVDLLAQEEEPTTTARSLPLFLLGGAFYPSGINYIHVFEMKYRTMMFDCANSDELFGYIHTDYRTGNIAKYGTMCKIIDRRLLEDGRQVTTYSLYYTTLHIPYLYFYAYISTCYPILYSISHSKVSADFVSARSSKPFLIY